MTKLATYLNFDRKGAPIFNPATVASATAYKEIFSQYLAGKSQSPEALAVALWDDFGEGGYRGLRERPILVLRDGWAAILDATFFSEKISIGPLFHVLRRHGARANEIFGAFGLAFEDYSNSILRRMYPEGNGLASRLRFPVRGIDRDGRDFEMDAVLNDVMQVVVFEEKAVWLKDEIVLGNVE